MEILGGGKGIAELFAAGESAFVEPRIGIDRHRRTLQILNMDRQHN